jgi:hypothetical protein
MDNIFRDVRVRFKELEAKFAPRTTSGSSQGGRNERRMKVLHSSALLIACPHMTFSGRSPRSRALDALGDIVIVL